MLFNGLSKVLLRIFSISAMIELISNNSSSNNRQAQGSRTAGSPPHKSSDRAF